MLVFGWLIEFFQIKHLGMDAYYSIQLTFRLLNIQIWGLHYHFQPIFGCSDLLVLNHSSRDIPPLLVNSIKAWVAYEE